MPVTAKLSRKFYETFGYKAELVKWMFAFWAGTTITLLATMIALIKL
jgi:hypothetical protein